MRLQPVAMVWPSAAGVYARSRLRPVKDVSSEEFVNEYAGSARAVLVDLEDGSGPQRVTGYARGLWDCWYIVEG